MSERAKQDWLGSPDHEKWAAAMMACQSGAPWECAEAEQCREGGSCFTTDRQGACAAWRMIQGLKTDNEVVRAHLDRAVKFLRYGREG